MAAWARQLQSAQAHRSIWDHLVAWAIAAAALAIPVRLRQAGTSQFLRLRNPRRDMVLVAAAGPAMNIALAIFAALAFHIVGYLPATGAHGWQRT